MPAALHPLSTEDVPLYLRPTKKLPDGDVQGLGIGEGPRRDPRQVRPLATSTLSSLRQRCASLGSRPPLTLDADLPDDEDVSMSAPPEPRAWLTAGMAVGQGRYLVLGFVAEGGMGSVFRVFDQDLSRVVAMKVLHPDKHPSRDLLERFVEEAQVTGQLQHPNIVPVYDIGLAEDSRVYYTMKLLAGRTLQAILEAPREGSDTRPGGLREKLDILRKVARAVAYANAKGVIHRDLKPENVLVGKYGEVMVMDWGLAKVLRQCSPIPGEFASPSRVASLEYGQDYDSPRASAVPESDRVETLRSVAGSGTHCGTVVGTPLYMAPEQAQGGDDQVDARTDVYGLGGLLYALLTGLPPRQQRSPVEVLREVTDRIPVIPPRKRIPHRRIPRQLEAITRRAMAVNPDDRYPSASAFIAALDRFETQARRSLFPLRQRSLWQRLAPTAGIAAGLLGLVGLAAWVG